jgi:hypothetical protein
MDGIVIGRSPTSNALKVYNPRNRRYYKPDSYCIDPYHLPTLVYPDIKYDGSLFCYLLRDENPHMDEKYPQGTRIEQIDPFTNSFCWGWLWTSLSLKRLLTALLVTFPPQSSLTMVPMHPFFFRIWHH